MAAPEPHLQTDQPGQTGKLPTAKGSGGVVWTSKLDVRGCGSCKTNWKRFGNPLFRRDLDKHLFWGQVLGAHKCQSINASGISHGYQAEIRFNWVHPSRVPGICLSMATWRVCNSDLLLGNGHRIELAAFFEKTLPIFSEKHKGHSDFMLL